jgi:periplasmic divalent cation tolerance protein
MEQIVIVLTTAPDAESAKTLADGMLLSRLAACVTRLPGATSQYWWAGKIETAQEELLLIKTANDRLEDLKTYIQTHHPYETPECLCVAADSGLAAYLQWVRQETLPQPTRTPDQSSSS